MSRTGVTFIVIAELYTAILGLCSVFVYLVVFTWTLYFDFNIIIYTVVHKEGD